MHNIDAHILISRFVSESRHILNTNKMNQCSWSIINLHAAIDHNRESLQQSIHINIFVWMPANPMLVIKSLLITYYFWKGNNFLLYFLFKFQLQKRYWIYYQIVYNISLVSAGINSILNEINWSVEKNGMH